MDLSHVQATHLSRDGSASRFRRTYDDIKTRSGLILYAFQQEVKVLVILCNEWYRAWKVLHPWLAYSLWGKWRLFWIGQEVLLKVNKVIPSLQWFSKVGELYFDRYIPKITLTFIFAPFQGWQHWTEHLPYSCRWSTLEVRHLVPLELKLYHWLQGCTIALAATLLHTIGHKNLWYDFSALPTSRPWTANLSIEFTWRTFQWNP